jgi:hypothetical protein
VHGMQRMHSLFDGSSSFKGMKIMKTTLGFVCLLASIVAGSLQTAYAAESATELATLQFLKAVNDYKKDTTLFTQEKDLTIKGRNGSQPVTRLKKTKCDISSLKNVLVLLTKGDKDSDVEIPRIRTIYYDTCEDSVVQNKGDVEIYITSSPVTINFQLVNFGKTKWKKLGTDSVFVGHSTTNPVPPPTAPGGFDCGTVSTAGTIISFQMCSKNTTGKDLFYGYALHMDQTGSDNISVDIGIDPQIINHPAPGRPPPP